MMELLTMLTHTLRAVSSSGVIFVIVVSLFALATENNLNCDFKTEIIFLGFDVWANCMLPVQVKTGKSIRGFAYIAISSKL